MKILTEISNRFAAIANYTAVQLANVFQIPAISRRLFGAVPILALTLTIWVGGIPFDGGSAHAALSVWGGTATIKGEVFYNDRRNFGLFSARRDKNGAVGERCNNQGKRGDGTACSINWLAAQYMVVDVIEIDQGFFAPTAWDCTKEKIIGSATVNSDGTFTAVVSTDDDCDSDGLKDTTIKLRVRTRFCSSTWCISMRDENNDVYSLYHPGASTSKPLKIESGKTYDVGSMNFNPAGTDPATASATSMAANYWASIVDTALTLHRDANIPFYKDEYGEVEYTFPSTKSSTATALANDKIAISNWEYDTVAVGPVNNNVKVKVPAWVTGWTPAHEYGHILMQRAWGGGYGFKGVGISANDSDIANDPPRQIAFKEAWAEFTARAVFDEQRGCGRAGYDDNDRTAPNGPLGEGASWRSNVTKALCDWYDDRDDDDPTQAGKGDYFSAKDLYSMWLNLRNMYLTRASYGGEYKNPGLWFCDWVSYYLDVRKSVSAVGRESHDSYTEKIRDLIYNNKIGCFMGAPS